MSKYDYEASKRLSDAPFYALIMAAMRNADSDNIEKLKFCFPDTWEELYKRYHAPGGLIAGDSQFEEEEA